MWYHQHVIGHYAYINIDNRDLDLDHTPQPMREHRSIKWKPSHMHQTNRAQVLLIWSISVGIGLQFLNDIKANIKSSYNNVVPFVKLGENTV